MPRLKDTVIPTTMTVSLALLAVVTSAFLPAFSQVYVPDDALGYVDSDGVYTVIGNVKNDGSIAILPTVTIHVSSDSGNI